MLVEKRVIYLVLQVALRNLSTYLCSNERKSNSAGDTYCGTFHSLTRHLNVITFKRFRSLQSAQIVAVALFSVHRFYLKRRG